MAFMSGNLGEAKTRHLLLDLDGTLVGQRKHQVYWIFVLRMIRFLNRELGAGPLQAIRLTRAIRKALEVTENATNPLAPANEIKAARALAQSALIPEEEALRIVRELAIDAFTAARRCFYPVKGAREFIQWASGRYQLELATNPLWPIEAVLLRLEVGGIDPHVFGFVANAAAMCNCKPNPSYYEELCRIRGIHPAHALMIGDSETKDLPAAQIGIPVFLIRERGVFHEQRTPDGVPVYRGTYADLRRLLEFKEAR